MLSSPSKPRTVPFKADQEEGESPKALPIEPAEKPADEELLDGKKPDGQSEDKDGDSADREHDIYSQAVLQCKQCRPVFPCIFANNLKGSIDNPESCVMCSG